MKQLKPVLLLIFLTSSFALKASHIMGADIAYRYIQPKKYAITVKIYRECSGIPLSDVDFRVRCSDDSYKENLTFTRTAINDISLHCKDTGAPCSPSNTPTSSGVEEHVFEATVDFTQAPFNAFITRGCCEVKISAEQCCRNGAITTISPGNFYTDAMLNICRSDFFKDNSPVFMTPPIQYLCVNNIKTYDPSVLEIDVEDSLSFELVAPMNANGVNESYFAPFSPQKPITTASGPFGFSFDAVTGFVVTTPTNSSEVGVMVVQVNEWRKDTSGKMVRIGYVRREMELIMKNCGFNNDPYMTGNGKFSVCEGAKLCFKSSVKDDPYLPNQMDADTVDVKVINQIPGSSFTILDSHSREKEVEICWQTKLGQARNMPYSMTIVATDNNCADPRIAYKSLTIQVKPLASYTTGKSWDYRALLKMKILPTRPTANFSSYFLIRDTSSAQWHFSQNVLEDTFRFTKAGTYYIEYMYNVTDDKCPLIKVDTIMVTDKMITSVAMNKVSPILISPNPGSGLFNLHADNSVTVQKIMVYSDDGKLLLDLSGDRRVIDLSSLPQGHYTLQIQTENGVFKETVIISR